MTTDQATASVITAGHRGPDHRPDDERADQETATTESGAQRKLASARRTRWGVPSW